MVCQRAKSRLGGTAVGEYVGTQGLYYRSTGELDEVLLCLQLTGYLFLVHSLLSFLNERQLLYNACRACTVVPLSCFQFVHRSSVVFGILVVGFCSFLASLWFHYNNRDVMYFH